MPEGGKLTPITQGMIGRVTGRFQIQGASDGWFGPFQPLPPLAPPGTGGRQFDYPTGVNLNYNPRSNEPISFEELRALADNLPLLRLAIETRKDQVQAIDWMIKPKDNKKRIRNSDNDPRVRQITEFLRYPDGEHDFTTWMRMLIEEMLVTDAACIYPRPTRGGDLYSLDLVDGATIKRLIDADGRTPVPPNPAYQQILHGVPAADFTRDEIIYSPRNPRVNKFYGFSPVEQIIMTVSIALRRDVHTLEYYKAGSVPDAFAALPKEWTIDQVKAFQQYFDFLISGNSAERRKLRMMPGGADFKLIETKSPPLKDMYDEWLGRIVCWALSVSVSPLVSHVNRATGETMRLQATEEGLMPTLVWTSGVINRIFEKFLGINDLEFAWQLDSKEDPLQLRQADKIDIDNGIRTIDEVRDDRGYDPLGIDVPFVLTPNGPVPLTLALEAAEKDLKEQITAPKPDPNALPPGHTPPPHDPNAPPHNAPPPEPVKEQPNKEVGKLAKAPFGNRRLTGLKYDRPITRMARSKLRKDIAAGLREVGANVAKQLRALSKAKNPADEIDLSSLQVLIDPTQKQLDRVAKDSTKKILAQIGASDASGLVDQVNTDAADWARFRAAEMVGMKYDENGDLVPSDNADYNIDETTRDMIRKTIADGLDENIGMDEIAADLEDSFAFSSERAELIARTEITRANNQASLIAAKGARDELGLKMKKVWLTAGDEDVDEDICQPNEDEGPIDLDEDFPSGDEAPPGHPRCRCTLTYDVSEEDTSDDSEDDE